MKQSVYALVTALYDSKGADLYNEIYFPIIKYSVSKSVLESADGYTFGSMTGLQEYITDLFGFTIPIIVLKQSIKTISQTGSDVIITLYDKDNYYRVEKCWNIETKEDIEIKAESVNKSFHELSIKFSYFLDFHHLTSDKTFIDLLEDSSEDTIGIIKGGSNTAVGEEYANLALFVEWIKTDDSTLYLLLEQILWASIVAGFLKRDHVDCNVKTVSKVLYYLDTGLIMSILNLNSVENVAYARDLLRIIKDSGSYPRVHPVTLHEIQKILQSVEYEQSPRPGSSIECAFAANNIKLHDLLHIREHLAEILEKDYGIFTLPQLPIDEVLSIEKKYLSNFKVRELHEIRGSKKDDYYRDAHDVIMCDFVANSNNEVGISERLNSYFVTTNSGLIEFSKSEASPNAVISSGQVIMNLWLHNVSSSILKKSLLTDLVARCLALNQTSVRRKLRAFASHYKEVVSNQDDYNAMYTALIYRSNKAIIAVDSILELDQENGKTTDDSLQKATDLVQYVKEEKREREQAEQKESQRNQELSEQMQHLSDTLSSAIKSASDAETKAKEIAEALKISEEEKNKYKKSFENKLKESDLNEKLSHLNETIKGMESDAVSSISNIKVIVVILMEGLLCVLIIAIIILFVITKCQTIKGETLIEWIKTLTLAAIIPFLTTINNLKSLYILTPRVAFYKNRKEQIETWYGRHPRYKELLKFRK